MMRMKYELSSRDRLLQAINHSEPDHVPLYLKWWHRPYLTNMDDRWQNQFERAEKVLSHGLDDAIGFEPPLFFSNDVKIKSWREGSMLSKEYRTPKGTLRQVVHKTEDWPHGDDIPIFSDHVIPRSRSVKYLIENENDLEALACLFREPKEKEIRSFHENADVMKRFAEKKGVLIECGGDFVDYSAWGDAMGLLGGDALSWLCGLDKAMIAAFRNPDFIQQLLEIVFEWDMRYLRLVLEAGGVDVVVHRGWYENGEFWSPKMYQILFVSRIRKLVEMTHKSNAKFCYIMSTGIMPLLEYFKDMGIDVLFGVDPVQGRADLNKVKKTLVGSVCLWGGLNSAVTLKYGRREEIEKAVSDTVQILNSGGGFILSAVDQIFEDTPWQNVEIMINAWRHACGGIAGGSFRN